MVITAAKVGGKWYVAVMGVNTKTEFNQSSKRVETHLF